MSQDTDRADLVAFLQGRQLALPKDWNEDTLLIQSGVLDSLALFELILWIEERLGSAVDPTRFELALELGSMRRILAFMERRRKEAMP